MKFFVDSNVFVSGIVFSGTGRRMLLATFRGEHAFVISQDDEREVWAVMQRKFPRRREEATEVLSLLRVESVPLGAYEGGSREFSGLRDPKDAHVLAAAVVSRCDAVVTGVRCILVRGEVEGVKTLRSSRAHRLSAAAP